MNIMRVVSVLLLLCHRQLVRSASFCLFGDFDTQVQTLLANEMLSSEELAEISQASEELEDTLRTRWHGAKLHLYGSLIHGLGNKYSDADYYLQIPNYNKSANTYIIIETAKVLNKYPEKYGDIQLLPYKPIPRLTYYEIPLQRFIDLTFSGSDGVLNSNLIAYYHNLDNRSVSLAAIIKIWLKMHLIAGAGVLPNYAGYLMVVFYLQQKGMGPPGFDLQKNLPSHTDGEWNYNFEQIPFRVDNQESLYSLLGGFFQYYNEFNFKDYCVSPFAGRPIARSDLVDIDRIPEEFSLYKSFWKSGIIEPLTSDRGICVQDVFEHNRNVAERADNETVSKFIEHLKFSEKMFRKLPSDRFFRAIFAEDNHTETMAATRRLEADTILKYRDCLDLVQAKERSTLDASV